MGQITSMTLTSKMMVFGWSLDCKIKKTQAKCNPENQEHPRGEKDWVITCGKAENEVQTRRLETEGKPLENNCNARCLRQRFPGALIESAAGRALLTLTLQAFASDLAGPRMHGLAWPGLAASAASSAHVLLGCRL